MLKTVKYAAEAGLKIVVITKLETSHTEYYLKLCGYPVEHMQIIESQNHPTVKLSTFQQIIADLRLQKP